MDFEFAFKTLWGVATAAGWFWVNGLSAKLRAAEQDREALRERLQKRQQRAAPRDFRDPARNQKQPAPRHRKTRP